MFKWYRDAAKCYVYLADVLARKRDADGNLEWRLGFPKCRWFSRGWTLQELIAPASVEIFSREGERLGDKKSLEKEIHDRTGIPLRALQGNPLSDFSVDQRMVWIEKRETRYEEDKLWSGGLRDPCDDKERIELAKGGLLADAYRWVFDNPDFKKWQQLPQSRLLWIRGDPGKGKTILSLELNAESVTAAVEAFIQNKVLHLSRRKSYNEATRNEVHEYLSSNANGTFLWVALVCQALADPKVRSWQTLDKLQAFP
ncbi:hypothetical protein B0T26DRAFT_677546 [Lasiosphaeria miniovina]|uniref:Nephrocystin 3-like N-terminal domain-containing protein n=1 Tax=Lasiosphaeria miniovina TaxID=1954250 RepID=A0AA40DVE3_9PEZI|nr:uncharacterized protein B0T26DRAFT_677546 [Lasiosphaeria miniovina]KAK0713178.1 hypothetical protein B0T26DRAFT_677546 [Lasiosphaeria miniovina]